MERRPALVVLLTLALVVGGLAHLRTPPPAAPLRIPRHAVEPWMADALPGIGPARREAAVEAIRTGHDERLPASARPLAATVFSE
jgi:hypothetical protein